MTENYYETEPKTPEEWFWALFREKLIENGLSLPLYPHGGYAVLGEEEIGKCSIVAELNLQQKVLNLGIGNKSGSDPAYSNCFKRYQKELETELKKLITVAIPRDDYGYYAVIQFKIFSCDEDGFEIVIEKVLLKLEQYMTLIPQYLTKPTPHFEAPHEAPIALNSAYTTGDTFRGVDFTDMFNRALGTHYKQYMKCYIGLKKLGFSDNGIAWIVFMDNSVNGTREDYLFKNWISPDGNMIEEAYVGDDPNNGVKYKFISEGDLRLAFQRDPDGTGDKYKCKFVGVFEFKEYRKSETGFIRVHKKISDYYPL